MNTRLLTELVSLRYKLQWAAVRTRSGRIILFLAGSIVLGTFAALALFTGFEGGLAAVHSGRAEALARDAFSIIFLQAILVSNLTGLGMVEIFSETELRRFPLTVLDRLIARHVIAILDPFWLLYLSLYLGLPMGLFVAGNGSIAPTAGAALLLFLCNYVASRVVGLALHRLVAAGAGVLVAAVLVAGAAVHHWLEFMPPFAAANSMARGGFSGQLTILVWLGVLVPALAWLEQRPARQQRWALRGVIVWDSFFDRAGRCFGPDLGPLVAFWLRFNCRNMIIRRFVWFAPAASAAIAYALYMDQHAQEPYGLFLASLGALPLATAMVPGRVAVNRFGILDGGLKRLLLLPVRPSSLLRSSTYACSLLSLAMLPLALTAWMVVVPYPFDWRMIVMLACSALTGIFIFQAAAAWASVYDPVPAAVGKVWPSVASPDSWWMLLPFPAIGMAVYLSTLAVVGTGFARRKERILAVAEQKD